MTCLKADLGVNEEDELLIFRGLLLLVVLVNCIFTACCMSLSDEFLEMVKCEQID